MAEKYKRDLADYRLEKAKERLKSAEALLSSSRFDDSIGRSYYGIFSAARALLALKGLDSKKHSGVIALFNQEFIKTGRLPKQIYEIITSAKAKRERADYEDFVEFSYEEAAHQFEMACEFVGAVDRLLKE